MYDFAKRSDGERKEIFSEAAAERVQKPEVIEKDFWVCWLLGLLYGDKYVQKYIKFKGGTSLSKAYGLIERFSEDIDLLIDAEEMTDQPLIAERSSRQRTDFIEELRRAGLDYLKSSFLPKLEGLMNGVCSAEIVPGTYNQIKIDYPRAFTEKSLLPYILLEIGPVGASRPSENMSITPYTAEQYPELFKVAETKVETILAERTFWEKITILHANAHRDEGRPVKERNSRHYYDIHQMYIDDKVREKALQNEDLMQDVMNVKRHLYKQGWAHDENLKPRSFKLIPPKHVMKDLILDYAEMEEMFFYEAPKWEDIMESVTDLEAKINQK
ncbi:MAG: nucleotidyl transferase AbiEii/AbiGii toxin family protein [Candidatus Marinimicrobia bacterium]|nr:nucleotidyl transferase AbiEii/AbiGii toxin family protein [Candidatus Neomarinimicrobiota bacterium]